MSKAYHISRDSVKRHRAGHLPADPVIAPAPVPIKPVKLSLRSPEDVLEQLEWAVAETKALLEQAKAAGDLRLQDRLLQTALGALDKLAKSSGLYSDNVVVNIDQRQTKIVELYDSLPIDVLRRLKAGETTIEAVLEGAS